MSFTYLGRSPVWGTGGPWRGWRTLRSRSIQCEQSASSLLHCVKLRGSSRLGFTVHCLTLTVCFGSGPRHLPARLTRPWQEFLIVNLVEIFWMWVWGYVWIMYEWYSWYFFNSNQRQILVRHLRFVQWSVYVLCTPRPFLVSTAICQGVRSVKIIVNDIDRFVFTAYSVKKPRQFSDYKFKYIWHLNTTIPWKIFIKLFSLQE